MHKLSSASARQHVHSSAGVIINRLIGQIICYTWFARSNVEPTLSTLSLNPVGLFEFERLEVLCPSAADQLDQISSALNRFLSPHLQFNLVR